MERAACLHILKRMLQDVMAELQPAQEQFNSILVRCTRVCAFADYIYIHLQQIQDRFRLATYCVGETRGGGEFLCMLRIFFF